VYVKLIRKLLNWFCKVVLQPYTFNSNNSKSSSPASGIIHILKILNFFFYFSLHVCVCSINSFLKAYISFMTNDIQKPLVCFLDFCIACFEKNLFMSSTFFYCTTFHLILTEEEVFIYLYI
jgi:hypothetical protein